MSFVRRVLAAARPAPGPRACGPCRRADRRGRTHDCYGAVTGPDTGDRTTWVSCPCRCVAVLDDGLDVASPYDDTMARVLSAAPLTPGAHAGLTPAGWSLDDGVDDPHRHSSTG